MNESERLTLRARQILDDPTLSQNQRVLNPQALLVALAHATTDPETREAMLTEIADLTVRESMRMALAGVASA